MKVIVEAPGEALGEFETDGYVPAPGDVITVREGMERRYRVKERGVRLARLPTVTVAYVLVEKE